MIRLYLGGSSWSSFGDKSGLGLEDITSAIGLFESPSVRCYTSPTPHSITSSQPLSQCRLSVTTHMPIVPLSGAPLHILPLPSFVLVPILPLPTTPSKTFVSRITSSPSKESLVANCTRSTSITTNAVSS